MTRVDPAVAGMVRVDRALVGLARVHPDLRDEAWHAAVDALLVERSALTAERDRGFRVTDRRKVRR
ncbi:MAG: hypothetical protein HOY78_02145 [Saccharothrix sp.]|nr:hypothetical protein [Saccharothrix sp.]